MHTIKNLLNSPYPVLLADGTQDILPARGTLENVEIHPMHLPLYKSLGYFQLTEGGDQIEVAGENVPEPVDETPKRGRPRKEK